MKHYIYCYTNKITNRKYVGQTNDLKRRKREHRSNSFNENSSEYDLLFHKKIRQYGEENFIFSVLEEVETENIQVVNEREIYWIAEMRSYVEEYGYNLTRGGDNHEHERIYSPEIVAQVKDYIKQGISYSEIHNQLKISIGYISGINNGLYFKDLNENYPLYKYQQSKEDLNYIIELLLNSDLQLTEIAKITGKAYSTIKKINSGALYPNLFKSYPIRKKNCQEKKADLIKQLLLQGVSKKEIIQQTGVSRQTVDRINQGKTHYDEKLTYPLR